jgi:hypothetical protein
MKTCRIKWGHELIEFRLVETPVLLWLEHRVLGPNGQPYPDGWYMCSDNFFCNVNREHPDLIDRLRTA